MFLAVVMILSNVPLSVLAQEIPAVLEEPVALVESTPVQTTTASVETTTEAPADTTVYVEPSVEPSTEAPVETTEEETEAPETTEAPTESSEASEPPVDEAVQAVQAMIDALVIPDEADYEDEETEEAWENALAELEDTFLPIYEAFETLTEEQAMQLDLTKLEAAREVVDNYRLSKVPEPIAAGTQADPHVMTITAGTTATDGASLYTWVTETLGWSTKKHFYAEPVGGGSRITFTTATGTDRLGYSVKGNSEVSVPTGTYKIIKHNSSGNVWSGVTYTEADAGYIRIEAASAEATFDYNESANVLVNGHYGPEDEGLAQRIYAAIVNSTNHDGAWTVTVYDGGTLSGWRELDSYYLTTDNFAPGQTKQIRITWAASATFPAKTIEVSDIKLVESRPKPVITAHITEGTRYELDTVEDWNNIDKSGWFTATEGVTPDVDVNTTDFPTDNNSITYTFTASVAASEATLAADNVVRNVVVYNPVYSSSIKLAEKAAGKVDMVIYSTSDYSETVTDLTNVPAGTYYAAITPKTGYNISGMSVGYTTTSNTTNMNVDVAVDANGRYVFTVDTPAGLPGDQKTYTLNPTVVDKEWKITWMNGTSEHAQTEVVHNSSPTAPATNPTKDANDQYTYTFLGWDTNGDDIADDLTQVKVTADAIYYAVYEAKTREYTIIWQDGNGNTLITTSVAYGTDPAYPANGAMPTKAEGAEFTYIWDKGWTPELTKVTGDATYTATFTATKRSYTIQWDIDGDGNVDTNHNATLEYGATPEAPGYTEKDGMEFAGWRDTSSVTHTTIPTVTGPETYTATYTDKPKYTITVTLYEGSSYTTQVVDGESLALTTPTREGYKFIGWYADADLTKAYDFTKPITAADEVYAKWEKVHTVTFNVNGGQGAPATITNVDNNATIEKPADPTRNGYVFDGWFQDEKLEVPFYFTGEENATPVIGDLTLCAKWTALYTVTYSTSGSGVSNVTGIRDGSSLAQHQEGYTLPTTTWNGYVFDKWTYVDAQGNTAEFTVNVPITGNITVTAQWNKIHIVTFMNNSVLYGEKVQVVNGQTVAKPVTDPDITNGAFNAWYLGTEAYDFTKPVTGDLTLVANYHTDANDNNVPDFDETITVSITGSGAVSVNGTNYVSGASVLFNSKTNTNTVVVTPNDWSGSHNYVESAALNTTALTGTYTSGTFTAENVAFTDDAVLNVTFAKRTLTAKNATVKMNGAQDMKNQYVEKLIPATFLATQTGGGDTSTVYLQVKHTEVLGTSWSKADSLPDLSWLGKTSYDPPPITKQIRLVWPASADGKYPEVISDAVTATITESRQTPTITTKLDSTVVCEDEASLATIFATGNFEANLGSISNVTYTGTFPGEGQSAVYTVTAAVNASEASLAASQTFTITVQNPEYAPNVKVSMTNCASVTLTGTNGTVYTLTTTPQEVPAGTYIITVTPLVGYDLSTITLPEGDTASVSGSQITLLAASQSNSADRDHTITVTAAKRTFSVTWYDGETLIETTTVDYGDVPSYTYNKPNTDEYTYTFVSWKDAAGSAPAALTGDKGTTYSYKAVITATKNEYTVTWLNEDGSTIKTGSVEYGNMPTAPEAPAKINTAEYTYTFAGWDSDGDSKADTVTAVTGAVTYMAVFTATRNTYTVTWKNGDTVLETDNIEYGATPEYNGAEPTKPADAQFTYTFAGWTPEITTVTGHVAYTAAYTTTTNTYTVTWYDEDGTTVLDTAENVEYGTKPVYSGKKPIKESDGEFTYTFKQWTAVENVDPSGNITGPAKYKAEYSNATAFYTVKIYNDPSDANKFEEILNQEWKDVVTLTTPADTNQWHFTGWVDAEGKAVTSPITVQGNIIVYAQWKAKYAVNFVSPKQTVDTQYIVEGEKAAAPQGLTIGDTVTNADGSFRFDGWFTSEAYDTAFDFNTAIDKATTVYAKWTRLYTVTFNANGGTNVTAVTVDAGSKITEPATSREGWQFDGWWTALNGGEKFDFQNTSVNSDLTLYAHWLEKFTVTFDTDGGAPAAASEIVVNGEKIQTVPTAPDKAFAIFKAWHKVENGVVAEDAFNFTSAITGNTTLKAVYIHDANDNNKLDGSAADPYQIYVWKDGTDVLKRVQMVENQAGVDLLAPAVEDPNGNSKVFIGWSEKEQTDSASTYTTYTYNAIWADDTNNNDIADSGETATVQITGSGSVSVNGIDVGSGGTIVYNSRDGYNKNTIVVTPANWSSEYNYVASVKSNGVELTSGLTGFEGGVFTIRDAALGGNLEITFAKRSLTAKNNTVYMNGAGEGKAQYVAQLIPANFLNTQTGSGDTSTVYLQVHYKALTGETWGKADSLTDLGALGTSYDLPTDDSPTVTKQIRLVWPSDARYPEVISNTATATIRESRIAIAPENIALNRAAIGSYDTVEQFQAAVEAALSATDSTGAAIGASWDVTFSGSFPGSYTVTAKVSNSGASWLASTNAATFEAVEARINSYTITWIDGNGNTLATTTVPYGTVPAAPTFDSGKEPTKTPTNAITYTWNGGWTEKLTAVTGNKSYTAAFTEAPTKHPVTWDINGELEGGIITTTAAYGTDPTKSEDAPAAADRTAENLHPSGWKLMEGSVDESGKILGPVTYQAVYSQDIFYSITYKLFEDDTIAYEVASYNRSQNQKVEAVADPDQQNEVKNKIFDAWVGTEGYSYESLIGSTVPNKNLTFVASWVDETNDNNVLDEKETITVNVGAKGSVTIDGVKVTNGRYIFDSTKEKNTIVFTPADLDGSDGSANFVETAKVGMASDSTNLAASLSGYSNYALTVEQKIPNGGRVEATFGTRTLNVKSDPIEIAMSGHGTTYDKGKVLEVYQANMTAANLVTVPAQASYGSEFVVYLKTSASGNVNVKELSAIWHAAALDGPTVTKSGIVQWTGDSRYPTLTSGTWTANIVDLRPEAVVEIGQIPDPILFDESEEVAEAIKAKVSAYYMDADNNKVAIGADRIQVLALGDSADNLLQNIDESWQMDGTVQRDITYTVGLLSIADLTTDPGYVNPGTQTVKVNIQGKVYPAKVTVTNDADMGAISIAGGEYNAHSYKTAEGTYVLPFTVTPKDGCYVASVTVNGTEVTGTYDNTKFSGSFAIANGNVSDGTLTNSEYKVEVVYGQRALVAREQINPVTMTADMDALKRSVFNAVVDQEKSQQGAANAVAEKISYADHGIEVTCSEEIKPLGENEESRVYTFTITWPADAKGQYPARSITEEVTLIRELKFNFTAAKTVLKSSYTADDQAAYRIELETDIRAFIQKNFVQVNLEDVTITIPENLPILTQGQVQKVEAAIHVKGSETYGEANDTAVFTLTGKVEDALVNVDTVTGGAVRYTAPVKGISYTFEAVPAENYFIDTMAIRRVDEAPAAQDADAPAFPVNLTWKDFRNGKYTIDLPNGDGLALGVVPTYTVTPVFVDPAITIEANREVGFNPFTDLKTEILAELLKQPAEDSGFSAPVATAVPEQLLTTPADADAVGASNALKVEYLVREKANYTVNISLDFIDLPIVKDYLKGKTVDIPMTLDELWATPDQEFESKAVDVEQLIKDAYDEIVDLNSIPQPDLNDLGGYVDELKVYFTDKFNALLDPYRNSMFVHNFGDQRDANGEKTNVEIVRIVSNSARFGEVISNEQTVNLVDLREDTVLNLTNPSVTMTYGFPASALTEALVPVITGESGQAIAGSVVYMDKVEEYDADDAAYTVTVRYPGSYDYQDAEATATVLVNKDTATVTVESVTKKYDGTLTNVPIQAVGDTWGKNAEMAKFVVGLNLANFGVDIENKTVVGLEGNLVLILPESIQKWLSLIPGFDGVDMSISELESALNTILDMLGVGGEGTNEIISSLTGILNMLPTDVVDLKITLGSEKNMPRDIGVYLTGAVTLDSNFETAFNVNYLLITPDGYRAELDWIIQDANGVISGDLLQNKDICDMGPKVVSVLEGSVEEASQYTTQIFLGLSVNNVANGNNDLGEIILTTDQSELTFGAYTEIGLLTDFGNTMYYAVPIVRAFVVVPETVKVELLDAKGNQNRDLMLDYNGQPQGFEVKVSDREGQLILNTGDNVGSMEHLIQKYYGLQTNITTYDSSEKPSHSGGYAALAIYLEKDAEGNILAFGMDAGAMVIEPSKSAITVEDAVGAYDGSAYDTGKMIHAESVNLPSVTPEITVITAQLTTDMSFEDNGLGAVDATANVDFPAWLDKILSEKYPDAFVNGVNAGDFARKLNQYSEKLAELGITEEMLTQLTEVLNSIPEDVKLTFHEQAEVAPTEIGVYMVVGIVTDPNHYPAVDSGALLITPGTTEAILKFTDEDENGIYMVDTLKLKDLTADAFVDGVYSEDATKVVTNLFVGVNINKESVSTTDYTTLLPGEYLQVSYILDLNQELYYAMPITRLITVAPNLYELSIWNNGVEDPYRQHTYDATPKGIGEIRIADYKGNPVAVNPEEGDSLTVTYYGVDLGVEGYKSTELPTNAGAYVALATFVDYDAKGDCIGVGVTAGAMIINLADATLMVEEKVVSYNAAEQFPKVTLHSGNLVQETDCAAIIVENYTDYSVEPTLQTKRMHIVLDDDLKAALAKAEDLLGYEIPEVIHTPEVLLEIAEVLKKVTDVIHAEEVQKIIDMLPENVQNTLDDVISKIDPAAEELIMLLETAAGMLPEIMPEAATVFVDSHKPIEAGTYEIYILSVSKNFMPKLLTEPAILEIKPVDINITIQDAVKVYGEEDPALEYAVTYTDVDGETVTMDYLPDVALDVYATLPMPVRNQKHTIVVNPQLSAGDLRNFAFGTISGAAAQNAYLNIKPAEVKISAADQTKVYGEADPAASYTWEMVNGQITEEELHNTLELVVPRIAGEAVGSYDYSLSYLDCSYIQIVSAQMGALTITPAELTVTVQDAEKTCQAPNPAFGYSVEGLVNEDWEGDISVTFSCDTGDNTAGTYVINAAAANDNYNITVIPGTLTIKHSENTLAAKAPTCTETGLTEGTECSACGKILVEQETVKALDHDWSETTYTWTGNTVCTAERVCKTDAAHKQSLSAVITAKVTIEPLCETAGERTHTAAFDTDWAETQTKTEPMDPLGHDFDEGKVTQEPDCTNTGIKTFTCRNDSTHTSIEVLNAKGHNPVTLRPLSATCTTDGHKVGSQCSVCKAVIWGLETIEATGHKLGDWYESKAPSCTEAGEERRDCQNISGGKCGHYETRELEPTGHSHEAVVTAPACDEKGYTTYTCACGDTYVDDYKDPTGHDWDDGVITTPSTCTTEGVKTFTCHNDNRHTYTDTVGVIAHSYTTVVTAPTCEEKGYTTYTCVCGDSYVADHVDSLGHSYIGVVTAPTCTEEGYTTYTCGACGDTYVGDPTDAVGHKWNDGVVTVQPTCTAKGEETFNCLRDATHTYTKDVEATGHTYQTAVTAPTCEEEGYTTYTCACGDTYKGDYVVAAGHAWDGGKVTTEATCSANGEMTFTCGNDKSHTKTEVIPAKGHTDEDQDYICDVCGEKLCTEHQEQTIPGFAASCETTGLTDGKKCSVCGEILTAQTVIPASGHDYGAGTVTTEPTCTETGVKTFTCKHDKSHTYTEEIPAAGHSYTAVVTEPTCSEGGYTTHTCACGDSYKDTYTEATGHKWNKGEITTEATCTEAGVKTFTCVNDSSHTRTEVVTAKGHSHTAVVTEPTCTEKGYTTYTCSCGDSYKDDYVEAAGHKYGSWFETLEPTCTETGTERRDCIHCDHFELREKAAAGHSYTEEVVAPTCTEKGYTIHTCACGDSYKDHYVEATGHTMGEWTEVKAATCTEKGQERRECANCDESESRETEATGHTISAWYISKAPTCTEEGEERRGCENCDFFETQKLEAAGHIWGQWTEVKAPTSTQNGEEHRYCENCDEFQSREIPKLDAAMLLKVGNDLKTGKPRLTWTAVEGAVKYQIYRSKTGKTGSFARINTVTSLYAVNRNAVAGTMYYYKVQAVMADGTKTDYSNTVVYTVKLAKPSPIKVTNNANTGKNVISWTRVEGAQKYQVWYSTTGKVGSFRLLKVTTNLTHTHQNGIAGVKYYYKVRAVHHNTEANSVLTGWQQNTCRLAKPSPIKVTNNGTTGKPVVSWTKVAGAKEYQVWWSATGKDGSFRKLDTVKGLTYTHKDAKAGTKYYYKVKAIHSNPKANSALTGWQQGTCKLAKPSPIKVTNNGTTGKPVVSWSKVAGAKEYQVWWSATGKDGSFRKLDTVKGLTYTHKDAKVGTKYYYKVKAIHSNPKANSALTGWQQGICKLAKPSPIEVTYNKVTGKPIVSWTKVAGAKEYQVWWSATGKDGSFRKLDTTKALRYTHKDAVVGTKYYYKVKAIHSNPKANSILTGWQQGTCKLPRPSQLKAANHETTGKNVISWAAVEGAKEYQIWWSATGKNGSFQKLDTTRKLTYTHSAGEAGTKYYYKVMAVHRKAAANSMLSGWVQSTCK